MKELFRKIKFNRKYFILGLFILAAVVILLPQTVNAATDTLETVRNVAKNSLTALIASPILLAIGTIAVLVMGLFGALDGLIIAALVNITKYNNFINEPSIVDAWVIVRDLCNMFFILILLVVAFATILRIESYQWKKILPKLLIMAVLINFSRTICGLIIDVSQVIMLTFVNTWATTGGEFVSMTSMVSYFKGTVANDFTTANWSVLQVVIGMLIGIMFLIISGIVLFVALSVFLMRVIMLWIYIVLSPLAFLAAAFPAGQKYATQWWSEFVKYIINGPVLAFFIWMALITSKQITDNKVFFNDAGPCFGVTEGMCLNNFLPFIISIGMLLGGLIITQQIGGIGSSIAGKGLDWAKKIGGAPLAGAGMAVGGLGKFGMFKAGRAADTLQMKGQGLLAKGVAKVTKGYFGEKYQAKSLNYRMIKEGWNRGQAVKMRDYEGTKAGAWQDQFNRTTSASIGIPIVSQMMRKKAEKQAKIHENNIRTEQEGNKDDEALLAKEDNPGEQEIIKNRIKGREEKINEEKVKMREEINKSQTAWTLGKLPPQRHMRLQEQERANEAQARIKKEEDLSEENQVHNFQVADRAGNESDKRAYINNLADTNGINSLFDDMGEDFTAENIIKVFEKKFGDAAGDVLSEVSRRAEAVGNYKFMGLHKFNVAQGRNRVASVDEQSAYVARKDNEKYSQNHARGTHFDSLYDKTKEKGLTLSDNGLTQLLHIASSTGRMKEIGAGNYQTRYGEMVIKLESDIKNKAEKLRADGRDAEADGLIKVLKKFKDNYGPGALAKKEKEQSGEQDASDNG